MMRDLAAASPDAIAKIKGWDHLADTCGISNPDNARRMVENMTRGGELIKIATHRYIPLDPDIDRRAKIHLVSLQVQEVISLVARAAFMFQRGWSTDRVCGALGNEVELDCNRVAVIRGALGIAGYLRVE